MTGITEVVLHELMQYARKLIELEIGVLACQKVVHPKVKKMLRECGIYVIDRLGIKFIEALKELSGKCMYVIFSAMKTYNEVNQCCKVVK